MRPYNHIIGRHILVYATTGSTAGGGVGWGRDSLAMSAGHWEEEQHEGEEICGATHARQGDELKCPPAK
jgi:hypothetical protein